MYDDALVHFRIRVLNIYRVQPHARTLSGVKTASETCALSPRQPLPRRSRVSGSITNYSAHRIYGCSGSRIFRSSASRRFASAALRVLARSTFWVGALLIKGLLFMELLSSTSGTGTQPPKRNSASSRRCVNTSRSALRSAGC